MELEVSERKHKTIVSYLNYTTVQTVTVYLKIRFKSLWLYDINGSVGK